MIKILILCSAINVGDVGHSKALIEAMQKQNITVQQYEIDASKPIDLIEKDYKSARAKMGQEKYITLAVGEKGLGALEKLEHDKVLDTKNSYTALSIHQYFEPIKALPLNYIAIPEATVDTAIKKEVVSGVERKTLTFAVPTPNPTEKQLKEAYDKWDIKDKPALGGKYIIVMLPGDAPDTEGKMQYYTSDSNERLFKDVSKLYKTLGSNYKVIIQNGPRTGKHDPLTGEVECTHEFKKGENPEAAVDSRSKDFIKFLKDEAIPHELYNFAFEMDGDKKKPLSVFNPLLYLAQNSDSYFVLPAESVSMLGQVPLYIQSDRIVAFSPSSMNEAHKAILELAVKRSYLSYFDKAGNMIKAKKPLKRDFDDAVDVAKGLMNGYNDFLKK